MTCHDALSRCGQAIPRRSTDLRLWQHLVGDVRRRQAQRTHHLNLGDRTADQTTGASAQRIPSTLSPLLLRCGQQMPSTGQLSFSGQSVLSAIFEANGAKQGVLDTTKIGSQQVLRKEYRREDQYLCIEIQPDPDRELTSVKKRVFQLGPAPTQPAALWAA